MKTLICISTLLLLAACMTPQERAERKKLIDQQDHQECVELGFKPKSDAYGDCRLRIKEMRVQAQRQVVYPHIGIGYGYGYHHRRRHW
ncbi:MAG: hypothetical protein MRY32_08550 [Rickettsiales bacterium]|nr:hypothetical protein [Rickettsiales bacterium]